MKSTKEHQFQSPLIPHQPLHLPHSFSFHLPLFLSPSQSHHLHQAADPPPNSVGRLPTHRHPVRTKEVPWLSEFSDQTDSSTHRPTSLDAPLKDLQPSLLQTTYENRDRIKCTLQNSSNPGTTDEGSQQFPPPTPVFVGRLLQEEQKTPSNPPPHLHPSAENPTTDADKAQELQDCPNNILQTAHPHSPNPEAKTPKGSSSAPTLSHSPAHRIHTTPEDTNQSVSLAPPPPSSRNDATDFLSHARPDPSAPRSHL
mmetsp:Transcript_52337/g.102444  ORF Transcript_52337/g.102444 Transcript_52337/m.102444 type:complete len:255 (-) Transcript_52337:683-1447(-)